LVTLLNELAEFRTLAYVADKKGQLSSGETGILFMPQEGQGLGWKRHNCMIRLPRLFLMPSAEAINIIDSFPMEMVSDSLGNQHKTRLGTGDMPVADKNAVS
jgi:hypothetical protein